MAKMYTVVLGLLLSILFLYRAGVAYVYRWCLYNHIL